MAKKITQYISIVVMFAICAWILLSIVDVNMNNMGGEIAHWNIFPLLMNATESWRK